MGHFRLQVVCVVCYSAELNSQSVLHLTSFTPRILHKFVCVFFFFEVAEGFSPCQRLPSVSHIGVPMPFWPDPSSVLYFVFSPSGDTGLSAVLCLLVWLGYRAQHCTLSSGLSGIPSSALYFVFWSALDTGLSAVHCFLVWRGYRAQRCTLSSGLTGIPGLALCFVF